MDTVNGGLTATERQEIAVAVFNLSRVASGTSALLSLANARKDTDYYPEQAHALLSLLSAGTAFLIGRADNAEISALESAAEAAYFFATDRAWKTVWPHYVRLLATLARATGMGEQLGQMVSESLAESPRSYWETNWPGITAKMEALASELFAG